MGIVGLRKPDLLKRLLASIDYPVEKLVLIDNGGISAQLKEELASFAVVEVVQHGNVGCAGSWNEVVMGNAAPWWMLVNEDIEFAGGDLRKMDEQVRLWDYSVVGNHGASWWVVTKKGIDEVGLFDENFWPAYYEDNDWERRALLTWKEKGGVGSPCRGLEGCNTKHVGGASLRGSEVRRAVLSRNKSYMDRKWGIGPPWVYERPFNDRNWPMWAWKYEPGRREELRRELIPMGVAP